MEKKETIKGDSQIEKMFEVGAHYAYTKTKRHSSAKSFIFGGKNGIELFDLEKTEDSLENAKKFVKEILAIPNKQILFVGSKSEVRDIVKNAAEIVNMPSVTNHWVGGTLTNFDEIKKRVEKYRKLLEEKETGELAKYTKKERLGIDKEILKLEKKFAGIVSMKVLPAIVFVVDSKYEAIAVEEAIQKGIPVISLSNSDCDIRKIDFPILANDSVQDSVQFFVNEVATACKVKVVEAEIESKK